MKLKLFFIATIFVLSFSFLVVANTAQAAIIETEPPIVRFFENQTVGGGAIIPAVGFVLTGDGADALTKVGIIIRASTTMAANQLLGVAVHREGNNIAGFQFGEDPMVGGAYAANPTADELLTLNVGGSGYVVPTMPTEFYIVASTSITSVIVNGDGFDIQLQTNYASTTVAGGVGTPMLTPQKKIILQQTNSLKISEVQLGAPNVAGDEWIELYNAGEFPINFKLRNSQNWLNPHCDVK